MIRQRWFWLTVAGTALLCAAGLVAVGCFDTEPEKPGTAYAFGHWWDLWWEVVLPCTTALLVAAGIWTVPASAGRGFEITPPRPG